MKILPWIKDYMLEREADWLTLPHGQGSWDLQVHRTALNPLDPFAQN